MSEPAAAPGEYRPVPSTVDLPRLEHEVLDLWRRQDTFAASMELRRDCPRWTFYEGPPTANGLPGTHHVEARVFKDVFPRFKTMRGHRVDRKAGWDCQGLHVEVGVEKELGLSGKRDIESYGIAAFNDRCRESVERHVEAFEELTERMGHWLDMGDAYRTMDAGYVQSVWWALRQIFDAGLLVEAHRVSPYCPRCQTQLSDHELGQPGGYETVTDPSVYVRMPLTSGPLAGSAALLVWTTTPWTLVSNTAVAVRPDVDYVVATDGAERLVVASALAEAALGDGWRVESSYRGEQMAGWTYQRPFELVDFPAPAHVVVLADYVTTEDGTGLVHQAPAFGPEDLEVCQRYGLPLVNPVQPDGHFAADVPLVGGQFFKHADTDLVADLARRGLVWRHEAFEHAYPHCWRCHTPLLYYASPAWYIRTTAAKDALLRENERTTWYPETIKWGRYGDWLRNNVDWSLSRTRYWGTPLPIWRCEQGHLTCVGSLAELGDLAGADLSGLDPHRPYVDEVVFACPTGGADERCGAPAQRVVEVIDAWFDSGSMPFAQWGYPYAAGSEEAFSAAYPAQFICEAIDQTRGWFYSLMAIGTLLFDRSSYENVVCLGLLVAADGRKMSKHLGNVLEPMPLLERHGADAVRWFMAAAGSPWAARRVSDAAISEIVRKVLLTYWNTVAFQALYARAAGWRPADGGPPVGQRPVLDRWLLSTVSGLVAEVTGALDDFDTLRAGTALSAFVDDLSNWYVRRSRRRFWQGDAAAFATLHETLDALTRLMAPLTPFLTERVWQDLRCATDASAPPSVHLADWPTVDDRLVDRELEASVDLARRLVELGRAARAEARVRTRQPLRRALVSPTARAALGDELAAEVCAELNVAALETFGTAGEVVDVVVRPNFRALGKRFGRRTPEVAAAVTAAQPGPLAAALQERGTAVLDDGTEVTPDDVVVTERPRAGWSVINEHGDTVALDLELDAELRRAGLAREAVRLVQEARKAAGLQITDRIRLTWAADGEVAEALTEHREAVAAEVLAVDVRRAEAPTASADPGGGWTTDADLGLSFALSRA